MIQIPRLILTSVASSLFLVACSTLAPDAMPSAEDSRTNGITPPRGAKTMRNLPRSTVNPPSLEASRLPLVDAPPAAVEPPPPDPASNIFFASGSDTITPAGRRQLSLIAEKMKSKPRADVTLIGHTDDAGSSEFNLALAQRRVEAVAAELQSFGISSRQIRRVSYGNEASGAYTCASASCRQNERRVELRWSGD
jgi:outer membrane protein OmpA-like peptidoglycan-associated protein